MGVGGGGVEKWRLKLTSAKVEVEVEAELGNKYCIQVRTIMLHLHPITMMLHGCRGCKFLLNVSLKTASECFFAQKFVSTCNSIVLFSNECGDNSKTK